MTDPQGPSRFVLVRSREIAESLRLVPRGPVPRHVELGDLLPFATESDKPEDKTVEMSREELLRLLQDELQL